MMTYSMKTQNTHKNQKRAVARFKKAETKARKSSGRSKFFGNDMGKELMRGGIRR